MRPLNAAYTGNAGTTGEFASEVCDLDGSSVTPCAVCVTGVFEVNICQMNALSCDVRIANVPRGTFELVGQQTVHVLSFSRPSPSVHLLSLVCSSSLVVRPSSISVYSRLSSPVTVHPSSILRQPFLYSHLNPSSILIYPCPSTFHHIHQIHQMPSLIRPAVDQSPQPRRCFCLPHAVPACPARTEAPSVLLSEDGAID